MKFQCSELNFEWCNGKPKYLVENPASMLSKSFAKLVFFEIRDVNAE